MKFECKHCGKLLARGGDTVAIISGTLGEQSLDDFKEFFLFHDECFVEVGGNEYYPEHGERPSESSAMKK